MTSTSSCYPGKVFKVYSKIENIYDKSGMDLPYFNQAYAQVTIPYAYVYYVGQRPSFVILYTSHWPLEYASNTHTVSKHL